MANEILSGAIASDMEKCLSEERFDFISAADKAFILAFDRELARIGYSSGSQIGSGYCWGRYMIIYAKSGVKSKQVAARIYIRDQGIVLRLFINQIDKHRAFLENTPAWIKTVFTGDSGACQHCHNENGAACKFRKTYTLDGRLIEKCNGVTFEFAEPDLTKLPAYVDLLEEFYLSGKARKRLLTDLQPGDEAMA